MLGLGSDKNIANEADKKKQEKKTNVKNMKILRKRSEIEKVKNK